MSGICALNVILTGGSADFVLSVVADAKVTAGREISAGLNDDLEQSQFERMLRPAKARVLLLPGTLTMILLPILLQGTSV